MNEEKSMVTFNALIFTRTSENVPDIFRHNENPFFFFWHLDNLPSMRHPFSSNEYYFLDMNR